jgi:hypothetical protein
MPTSSDEDTMASPSLLLIQKLCSVIHIKFHSLAQADGSSAPTHLSFCIPSMGEMVLPLPQPASIVSLSPLSMVVDYSIEEPPCDHNEQSSHHQDLLS